MDRNEAYAKFCSETGTTPSRSTFDRILRRTVDECREWENAAGRRLKLSQLHELAVEQLIRWFHDAPDVDLDLTYEALAEFVVTRRPGAAWAIFFGKSQREGLRGPEER